MSAFDKIVRAQIGRFVLPVLPPKPMMVRPEIGGETINGRCASQGYWRGWGIEFGSLPQQIARDPIYRRAKAKSKGRSVLLEQRRMNLYLLIRFFLHTLPTQHIVEMGVWRGGNTFFMADLLREFYPDSKVYALDTFEGMPAVNAKIDLHRAGDFSDANLDEIRCAATAFGLDNIVFVKGDVRQTLPHLLEASPAFSLAHIDLDIYEPIKDIQNAILDHMTPGGYLVYDDATVSSCLGATQAVEELIQTRNMHSEQIYPHFVFRAFPSS